MCICWFYYISLSTEINYFLTKPRKVFLQINPLGLPSKFLYFFRLTGIIPLFAGNISSLQLVCFCHSHFHISLPWDFVIKSLVWSIYKVRFEGGNLVLCVKESRMSLEPNKLCLLWLFRGLSGRNMNLVPSHLIPSLRMRALTPLSPYIFTLWFIIVDKKYRLI